MAQIPKGMLVKGPYKPISRDCAIYFSITVTPPKKKEPQKNPRINVIQYQSTHLTRGPHLQGVQNQFVKESCKQRLGKLQHAWQAPVQGIGNSLGP